MLGRIIECAKYGGPLTVPLAELETTRNPLRLGERQPVLSTCILCLACTCGQVVGTEAADCWTPQMVHFESEAVSLKPAQDPAVQFLIFEGGSSPDAWQFFSWLHRALPIDGWFGNDGQAIGRWAGEQKHRLPVRILWQRSNLAIKAGVDVDDLATTLNQGSNGTLMIFRD